MLLYARPGGTVYGSFLFATISDDSIVLAIAVLLRVLALALPMILLFARNDPTALADASPRWPSCRAGSCSACSPGRAPWGCSSTTGAR